MRREVKVGSPSFLPILTLLNGFLVIQYCTTTGRTSKKQRNSPLSPKTAGGVSVCVCVLCRDGVAVAAGCGVHTVFNIHC